MTWPNFIESGKISFTFLLPIAILCGCLLFLPEHYQEALKIQSLSVKYSELIGPIFLICIVLISLNVFGSIYKKSKDFLWERKIQGYVNEHMFNLDPYEQGVLYTFKQQNRDSLPLSMNNPSVQGLISKRILYQVGSTGRIIRGEPTFNYSITERAKNYMQKHNM